MSDEKWKTIIAVVIALLAVFLIFNFIDNKSIEKEQEAWEQEQIEKYGDTLTNIYNEASELTDEIQEYNEKTRKELEEKMHQ